MVLCVDTDVVYIDSVVMCVETGVVYIDSVVLCVGHWCGVH